MYLLRRGKCQENLQNAWEIIALNLHILDCRHTKMQRCLLLYSKESIQELCFLRLSDFTTHHETTFTCACTHSVPQAVFFRALGKLPLPSLWRLSRQSFSVALAAQGVALFPLLVPTTIVE